MKLTLQVKLLPNREQSAQLRMTMERFNKATNWLAGEAFKRRTANKFFIQKLYYTRLRTKFGLSSAMTIRCIDKASTPLRKNNRMRPKFRKYGAMSLDENLVSFKRDGFVSLRTLEGRIILPIVMGTYQKQRFSLVKGESDLVLRKDGKWFLFVVINAATPKANRATDFIGVDLGINNIATDSDGAQHSGSRIEAARQRYLTLRASLQKAVTASREAGGRPKNICRKLKMISRSESGFKRDVNHQISKQLVVKAKATSRGIAIENLHGIRQRSKPFRKPLRAQLAVWSFSQLRSFIVYKAQIAGVDCIAVAPNYTSQTCSRCGFSDQHNRVSEHFACTACGYATHADMNAAVNVSSAAVNQRKVSESAQVALLQGQTATAVY